MKNTLKYIFLLGVAVFLASCGGQKVVVKPVEVPELFIEEEPIPVPAEESRSDIRFPEAKIGFIGPLTGDNSEYGIKVKNGMELAISRFNAAHKSEIGLIACDSKDDAEESVNFLKVFVSEPKAVAVVGPVTGVSLEEIIKTSNNLGLPVITPTVLFQGEIPGNTFFFRNNLSPDDEGRNIAEYAFSTLKAKKFAVVHTDSLYSRLCAEAFKSEVTASGGEIVKEVAAGEGQYDLKEQMLSLGGIDPHIIKEIIESDKQNLESVTLKLVSHIKFLCTSDGVKKPAKVIVLNFRNIGKDEQKLREEVNFGSQLAKKSSYGLARLKELEVIEMAKVYKFLSVSDLTPEYGIEAACKNFDASYMVTGSVTEVSPGSYEAETLVYDAAAGLTTNISFAFTATSMPEGNVLGLDAVYIPVEFQDAENIVSHLAFFDLKVTFLGSSRWYNKKFLSGAAKQYLEGCYFTVPFFIFGSSPLTASFVEEYRANFYENPDELSSFGFDTARLVLRALENGASGKADMAEGLNTMTGVTGLNGSYTSVNREFKRKLHILTVKEGELTEVR